MMTMRLAGMAGAATAGAGVGTWMAELSYWTSIMSDVGIFLGGAAAIATVVYTVVKQRSGEGDAGRDGTDS